MVKALANGLAQVEVSEIEGEIISIIDLRAGEADVGKVTAEQGRHADAMRTL
jgi:predicted RNA-binding protein YlqC (UPF0109 family)